MKKCLKCKVEKPVDNFYKHKSFKDGLYNFCKPCWSKYQHSPERKKRKNIRNMETMLSDKRHLYLKDYTLKKKYGISLADYNKKLIEQNGKCAICEIDHTKCLVGLSVDHDHSTGKVRELLCRECNSGLGKFKDRTETLLKAVEYLKSHESIPLNIVSIRRL